MAASDVEIEIGVRLLDMILARSTLVRERHDNLLIRDHVRAEQTVLVGVALAEYGALATGGLRAHHDRILVPLVTLDADTEQVAYASNESGELMPHYPERDLMRYLAAGLVGYARNVNAVDRLDDNLERAIRNLSSGRTSADDVPTGQVRIGLDDVLERLIDTSALHASPLSVDPKFRSALRAVLDARFSVVLLDPRRGPFRMLRYQFQRTLEPIQVEREPAIRRYWSAVARSGRMDLGIPLHGVGGVASYSVKIDAPPDTWFGEPQAKGFSERMEVARSRTTLLGRVKSPPDECTGSIVVALSTEPTGVIRAGVWGAAIVLATCIVGTALVLTGPNNDLPGTDDGSTALLLLFPGVVASLLAPAPEHPLTATFQFPSRFVLWGLGVVMFVLAGATALGLKGPLNLVLWLAGVFVAAAAFWSLLSRFRFLSKES